MVNIEVYDGPTTMLWEAVTAWRDEADPGFQIQMDPAFFIGHLGEVIDSPNTDLLVWREPGGLVLGFMGVHLLESPLSGEIMVEEHMWYILPEYRSLAATRAFLAAAEVWGRDRGATQFLLTASRLANIDAGRVMRMYGRLGFKPFETVFIRPIGGS